MYMHNSPMQAILCGETLVTVELMDDEGAIVRKPDGSMIWADLSWLQVLPVVPVANREPLRA